MGKKSSSNPVDEYRRKERKKELSKNKVRRITARDARVLETESISSIQQKIKALEKQTQKKKLDNHQQMQYDVYQKQLKLLQQQQQQQSSSSSSTTVPTQPATPKQYPYAKCSIYYDPQMNPFGVPEPGKPMLYHKKGGGVTKYTNEAVIPPQYQSKDDEKNNEVNSNDEAKETKKDKPTTTQSETNNATQAVKETKSSSSSPPRRPKAPPLPKEQIPPPPPPMATSKKKLKRKFRHGTDDIWGDEAEEQQLQQQQVQQYYYKDNSGNQVVQGPFPFDVMKQWILCGMFLPSTPISKDSGFTFQPLSQLQYTHFQIPKPQKQEPTNSAVDDRIAALCQSSNNNIEDRIAALRQQPANPLPDTVSQPPANQQDHDDEQDQETTLPSHNEQELPAYPIMEDDSELPSYSIHDNMDDNDDQMPSYPIHDYNNDDDDENGEMPSYPLDGDMMPSYPIHDDNDDEIPSYPTSEDVTNNNDKNMYHFPVTASYPNTDDAYNPPPPEEEEAKEDVPKKSTYQGDKDVVGLIPTHLRKKRMLQK